MLWCAGCSVLVLSAVLSAVSGADMVFRCPGCTAERQALCPRLTESCTEIVREPGCGCCPVCARQEGHTCGVYTPRCATGLRCYPTPGAELPLEQLVQGMGQCRRRVEPEVTTLSSSSSSEPQQHTSEYDFKHSCPHGDKLVMRPSYRSYRCRGEVVEVLPEQGVSEGPVLQQKPSKQAPWLGPKESAVRQHRQELKTKMKTNKVEDAKPTRPKQTQCQQELDQVLERISKMPFRDNRGPLEDLYALHIPNCDRRGHYNLKQCNMSLHGQRGECWCVSPHTGHPIPAAPTVRGDPNCGQYLTEQDLELPDPDQM